MTTSSRLMGLEPGWSKWHVSSGGVTARRSSDRLRYESVSSGAFYQLMLQICDAAQNVDLRLGTSVLADPLPPAMDGPWKPVRVN